MCLILLAIGKHREYKLILAANRDEYYERRSEPPHFWQEAPHLLAGRDMVALGTWLGITRKGHIAAVTNYRDPANVKPEAPSRGKLVSDFLLSDLDSISYLDPIRREKNRYNGFNLILGNRERITWYSNRSDKVAPLPPGVYGLSNHLLDTPWPKVVRAKALFEEIHSSGKDLSMESLFRLLKDQTVAPDDTLPRTGVPLEWERILSPIFITSPSYGTRSSTVLLIDKEDRVTFLDRTFNGRPEPVCVSEFEFVLEPTDRLRDRGT
jgi:uncharacterized protein with NRDE domain